MILQEMVVLLDNKQLILQSVMRQMTSSWNVIGAMMLNAMGPSNESNVATQS